MIYYCTEFHSTLQPAPSNNNEALSYDDFIQKLHELNGYSLQYLSDYQPDNPSHRVLALAPVSLEQLATASFLLQDFGYPYELFLSQLAENEGELKAEKVLTNCLRNGARLQGNFSSLLPSQALPSESFVWKIHDHKQPGLAVTHSLSGTCHTLSAINKGKTVSKDTISVIIPCYNYGRYLSEAIESVLRQTRVPDEIVIIDDGSNDDSPEIAHRYARDYPGLITFKRNTENLGIIRTFNLAVEISSGDLICFLGADNRFRPDYIEKTSKVLETTPSVAIAYTDYALFGSRARLEYSAFPEARRGQILNSSFFVITFPDFTLETKELLKDQNFIHGSSMFRREAFTQVGGYIAKAGTPEDHGLFQRIVFAGWDAFHIADPLLEYRQHSAEQANQLHVNSLQLANLRKTLNSLREETQEYERLLKLSEKQEALSKQEVRSVQTALRATKNNLKRTDEELVRVKSQLHQLQKHSSAEKEHLLREVTRAHSLLHEVSVQNQELHRQLFQIYSSVRWRLASKVFNTAGRLLPKDSPQYRLTRKILSSAKSVVKPQPRSIPQEIEPEAPTLSVVKPHEEASTLSPFQETPRFKVGKFSNGHLKEAGNLHPSMENSYPQKAVPLLLSQPFAFSFTPPLEEIEFFDIQVATYGSSFSGAVELRVYAEDHEIPDLVVRSEREAVEDNSYIRFTFPHPLPITGKPIRCEISVCEVSDENALAIWVDERPREDFIGESEARISFHILKPFFRRDGLSTCYPKFLIRHHITPTRTIEEGAFGKYSYSSLPRDILPDEDILFSFRPTVQQIDELCLLLATYDRINNCRILFQVYSSQDRENAIQEKVLEGTEIENNAYVNILNSPLHYASKTEYIVRVSTVDSSPTNCIALWAAEGPAAELPECLFDTKEEKFQREKLLNLPRGYSLSRNILSDTTNFEILVLVESYQDFSTSRLLEHVTNELEKISATVKISSLEDFCSDNLDISEFNVVWFLDIPLSANLRHIGYYLEHLGILTIYSAIEATEEQTLQSSLVQKPNPARKTHIRKRNLLCQQAASLCDILVLFPENRWTSQAEGATLELERVKQDLLPLLSHMSSTRKKTYFPTVSIVSVLYRKSKELPFFLQSIAAQSYAGKVELLLVDDTSPDNSVEVLHHFYSTHDNRALPELTLIRNPRNLGNCLSRNAAIEQASGEIIVIIDADHVLNKDFLRQHVIAHGQEGCDIVIGPLNIETGPRDPFSVLAELELDQEGVLSRAELQDQSHLPSYLNCITRNFSIKKRSLPNEPLFDELFSYSEDPESGFGWEDVEMGYRLYKHGRQVRFCENAFALHISHPPTTDSGTKPYRSLKNFRRLYEKHPELRDLSRAWTLETYGKIKDWVSSSSLAPNEDVRRMDSFLETVTQDAPAIHLGRRLRVLSYRWHCPHQYELYHLPLDFFLMRNLGTGFTNDWDFEQRPFPRNASFVNVGEIDPADFDLAIFHFDENVLRPDLTNGVISPDWGLNFRWFLDNAPIPKIAVCHGTPQFVGQYDPEYERADLGDCIEASRRELVEALRSSMVVVNSYQAASEWRFHNSTVIWHGMNGAEYAPSFYERGILSLGRVMKERPHYRGYRIFQDTVSRLTPADRPETLSVKEPALSFQLGSNAFARERYRNYVNAIRRYSIYFNPTVRSPMPRSRTDAMLCGLATVSYESHDVDQFIRNGENGFYSKEPGELAEFLTFLLRNPERCRTIGLRGRETALQVFNRSRYLSDWQRLIQSVL